ncbi:PAS domain-containing protein [Thiosulfatimonas sediminis]|uniref:PAS domain-containing protein n=1 Tax=Thiosulfatimonas sediminis TaxID=2675054 RepID=UPI0015643700|nr:PAS domain-containing protein [Thiosulfatimonas sediminis]
MSSAENELQFTPEEQAYLANTPQINVGFTSVFEPLLIRQKNGSLDGALPEIYNLIAEIMPVEFVFQDGDWLELLADVQNSQLDAIAVMNQKTAQQRGLLTVELPFEFPPTVFALKNRNFQVQNSGDLKVLKISYAANILYLADYLEKQFIGSQLIPVANSRDAIDKVMDQSADVAILHSYDTYLLKKTNNTQIEPIAILSDVINVNVIGVDPDNPLLQSILQKAVNHLSRYQLLDVIEHWSYISTPDIASKSIQQIPIVSTYVWIFVGTATLLLLLALYILIKKQRLAFMQDSPVSSVSLKPEYFIALITVSLFTVLIYTLNMAIKEKKVYAEIINISGKQRMWSQNTVLLAKEYFKTLKVADLVRYKSAVGEMSSGFQKLTNLQNTYDSQKIYFNNLQIGNQVEDFLDLHKAFIQTNNPDYLNELFVTSQTLLVTLDGVVNYHEKFVNSEVDKQLYYAWLVLGLLIFTILIEFFFVYVPSLRGARNLAARLSSEKTRLDELNQQLMEQEGLLQIALDKNGWAYWDFDLIHNKRHFSSLGYQILGYDSSKEVPLNGWEMMIHPDDRAAVMVAFSKLLNAEVDSYENTYRILNAEKRYIWNRVFATVPKRDPISNEPQLVVGIFADVTEEIASKNALLNSEKQLKQAHKISHLASWTLNHESGQFIWADEIYPLLGTESSKLGASFENFLQMIHPMDRTKVQEAFSRSIQQQKELFIEHRLLIDNKAIKYVVERAVHTYDSDGNLLLTNGSIQDITDQKNTEMSLIEANKNLSSLAQNVPGMVYSFHLLPDGRSFLPYASEAIYQIYGVHPEEVVNDASLIFERIHKYDINRVSAKITESETNLSNWVDEYRVNHPTKGTIWVKGFAKPERQPDGSTIWYGYLYETTNEKLAEQAREQFALQLDIATKSSNQGIWVWDLRSNELHWDENMHRLYGIKSSDKVEYYSLWKDALLEEDAEQAESSLQAALNNNRNFDAIFRIRRPDGEIRHVKASAALQFDEQGNKIAMVGTNLDITPLQLAIESAQKANQSKSAFLANMSHEIRTPLNGIIGLTNLVLESELEPVQRDYLTKVQKTSNALTHIINDILDYSKIEAGKLDIVPTAFHLDDLLSKVSDLFAYPVHQKGVSLIFTIAPNMPQILVGDVMRLTQVLNNLVGNAVKFTKQGHIRINAEVVKQQALDITLKFDVEDTGIGMNQAKQQKLFQAFEQGDSTTTKEYGGTGLGLMISKKLVQMMGGDISVNSQENKGSTFSFITQLKVDQSARPIDLSRIQGRSVLVVDDNEIDREFISRTLDAAHVKVSTAASAKEALAIMQKDHFDCVLTDWKMPDMDGLELVSRIVHGSQKVDKVIMVTAFDREHLMQAAKKKNVQLQSVLSKPFTPSSLFNVLFDLDSSSDQSRFTAPQKFQLNHSISALVAEDNEVNQIVSENLLNKLGCQVALANDGLEAVQMAKTGDYDVIFMDLHMPKMDGYEAARQIRLFNADIPIFALSAAVMQEDKTLAYQSGMNAHLAKPIDESELTQLLDTYFQQADSTEGATQSESVVKADEGIPEQICSFDMQALYDKWQFNDFDKLYSLYVTYLNSFSDVLNELDAFSNDKAQLLSLIHKIKGASANMLFEAVTELCTAIEQQGVTVERLALLKEALSVILNDIKRFVVPLVSGQKRQGDKTPAQLEALLLALIDDLEMQRFITYDRLQEVLDEVLERTTEAHIQALFEFYEQQDDDALLEGLKRLLVEVAGE